MYHGQSIPYKLDFGVGDMGFIVCFYPPTRKGSGDIAISLASVRLSVRRQKLVRSITFIPFEIFDNIW